MKYLLLVLVAGGVFLSVFLLGQLSSLSENQETTAQVEGFSTDRFVPTQIPTQTPTPISTVKTKVLAETDPIIDCVSSAPNCSGYSIRVRQSQCSKITCCQVGNVWSVYPSKEKCDEDQKAAAPKLVECVLSYGTFKVTEQYCNEAKSRDTYGSSNSKNYPTNAYPTYTSIITPYQTPTISEEQRLADIQHCKDNAKRKYDSESSTLRNTYKAAGALSSSDYGMASKKLQDDYNYWLYLCENAY